MIQKQKKQPNVKKNLEKVKHKIVVLSGKGGVGKSTVAANLAVTLSAKGYKVGLLDSDLHGPSIPKIVGIEDEKVRPSKNGISPVLTHNDLKVMSMGLLLEDRDSPVIWRGPMKMGAIRQLLGEVDWGELDFLIIDLPPGTGDEPLSIAQLIDDISGAIVVTTPQDVAIVSVRKSINFVKKLNMNLLGVVENMSGFTCPNCGKKVDIFKTGGGKKAAEDFKIPYLGSIPLDPEIVQTGDSGNSFMAKNKDKNTADSFNRIVKNIEEVLGGEK